VRCGRHSDPGESFEFRGVFFFFSLFRDGGGEKHAGEREADVMCRIFIFFDTGRMRKVTI